ncbi:tail protein X [Brevibacillus sp. MER 51]|uniref:tail protein X n=1 Tax=Brevibacillus sp. MER 51 TaxID=2939560 RepID=UPI00203E1813|nr:tail protein X [Brevibacillus sp. MER 51]MCM3141299.1 tail protein X [Brevibacillus sp. MER 51]
MSTYTTKQGDTFDGISFQLFGTDKHMPLLIASNPKHATTVIFSAEVKLSIPNIPVATPSSLPPWRKG